MGLVGTILGVDIERSNGLISLSQNKYLNKQLGKFNVEKNIASRKAVPITKQALDETINSNSKRAESVKDNPQYPYRSLIGSLLYANICSRPDISFALSTLASHNNDPKMMHWLALLDLLRYARDTAHHKVTYGKLSPNEKKNEISVYADADFAMDVEGR